MIVEEVVAAVMESSNRCVLQAEDLEFAMEDSIDFDFKEDRIRDFNRGWS
jgi:hypothetical protein